MGYRTEICLSYNGTLFFEDKSPECEDKDVRSIRFVLLPTITERICYVLSATPRISLDSPRLRLLPL